MHKKKPAKAGLLLILSAILLAPLRSSAQDIDQQPAQTGEVEQRIDAIDAAIVEVERLENLLAEVPPGMRVLMLRRVDDKKSSAAQQVIALADAVLAREAKDQFNQTHRDRSIAFLERLVPWIDQFHSRNNAEVARRLGAEASLSPSDAAASAIEVDRYISASIRSFQILNSTLDNLERFGIDVADRRATVTARVRESAEMLAVAIELDGEQLQKLRYRLTLSPDDADLQILINVAVLKRNGFARNLGSVSDLLQKLGVDPSEYRSLVLVVTGDVASRILDTGVMSTLAKQWSRAAWNWINDNGLTLTIKLSIFLLILFAFRSLSRLIRRAVERGVNRVNLSFLLRNMIVSSAGNAVMALGIMIALSQMGISLGPLLAGLGVLGFIVGFALQDTLGNFASGMMILIYRPYDVGDLITAAGVTGKVKDMSLVYTMILTLDNQKMIVPNSKIWGDVIQNVTAQRVRRVDLVFGISYADDIDKAEKVLAQIVDEHELTLDDPEPMIRLHTLNESSVDFIVRPWVKSNDYWDVYWDVTREVKMRFDREGISIPFPQRDVHHYYSEAPPAAAKS